MKDLLQYLLEKLVAHPDKIVITEEQMLDTQTFDITLEGSDCGTVIGKGGNTIQALRTLLSVYQAKNETDRKRIFLNVTPAIAS